MDRLRGQLAWEFSVPRLLAAYDKAFATGGTGASEIGPRRPRPDPAAGKA